MLWYHKNKMQASLIEGKQTFQGFKRLWNFESVFLGTTFFNSSEPFSHEILDLEQKIKMSLYLRGVSEKYPTCVHISVLVLFFVIRTVASFEVVPIWLNHTLPAVLPHVKVVLERRFWNGLQLARRITLNRLDVVEPLSFERHFQFWEHPKVARSYVGTVRRIAKLSNLVFHQKLLHKVRWMRWRVIVVKKPVTAWPETRSFSSHGITQSFQNFNVIFFVGRLTFWSKFVVHNIRTIKKNNQHWLDMAPTLTPFLNRLYHSFICVMPILSSTKAFCIISIVSVQLLLRLKQKFMHIRWSVLSVIFNCKKMRRTEKARWT